MKFALFFVATASALRLSVDPVTVNNTVVAAAANKKNEAIAFAFADDQAEHTRHHYGKFTPSGTNTQTWGNESTGGFTGANRVSGIENTTSMLPHGHDVVVTSNI